MSSKCSGATPGWRSEGRSSTRRGAWGSERWEAGTFIELCLDEADRVWLMLHSGSRTLGAAIGEHFIQSAREEAERLDRGLPDRDLGWLDEGTGTFDR